MVKNGTEDYLLIDAQKLAKLAGKDEGIIDYGEVWYLNGSRLKTKSLLIRAKV